MSTHILSACWALSGMSSTQKLVLISLADQANDDGVCWPSIPRTVKRTCLSERAVRAAIRELEMLGILETTSRSGTSSVYKIDAKKYADLSSTPAPDAAPAPDAGNPGTTCRPPRHHVPPNRNRTIKEPSEAGASAKTATADSQEYLERITKHERANQPVTMSVTWKPSGQFPALLMRAGIPAERFTDEVLAKFQIHHNGTSNQQNIWESLLVNWIKREQPGKTASIVPIAQSPAYREYQPPVLPERTPEMAANARKYMSKVRELLA